MTLLVALLAGIFPVYPPGCIQGKSPLQGNIRYISLAVPLILEATMVQGNDNLMTKFCYRLSKKSNWMSQGERS